MSAARHVIEVGRWRVSFRFGRFRFGFHRIAGWSAFSWGAGFCCGNAVRRNKGVVR